MVGCLFGSPPVLARGDIGGVPARPVVLRSRRFVPAMAHLCLSQKLRQSCDVQAESSSGKPRRDLLEQPAVSVRITEPGERAVAAVLGIWAVDPQPPKQIGLVLASVHVAAVVEYLADLDAARDNLIAHGVDAGEVFHFDGEHRPVPGPDPTQPSYGTYASFSDVDGNRWVLQQVTKRLPGRGLSLDVATLTELLQETETRHGAYEPTAPKHHWSGWYAAYVIARERGRTSDEAAKDATRHIEGALAART